MKNRFICILEIEKQVVFSRVGASGTVIEKLFIPSGQYKKFAEAKNKADGTLFDFW